MEIQHRILEFIAENEVMTIATTANNIPWCATVFYVYLPENNLLVFMSDHKTRHIREGLANNRVAGTIISKNVSVTAVQGLQFEGLLKKPEEQEKTELTSRYLWAFPMAILHNSTLWTVMPTHLKLTDFRLGFGKKLTWQA